MSLELGTTFAALTFLVAFPVGLFFKSDLNERYHKKIIKVINALIGSLEQPLKDLRQLPVITNHQNEEDQYKIHHQFMQFIERNLLDKFNDYHDMKYIQKNFEPTVNKILFKVPFFMIPVIFIQIGELIFPVQWVYLITGTIFYILSLWIFSTITELYHFISDINEAIKNYITDDNVFGNYDS